MTNRRAWVLVASGTGTHGGGESVLPRDHARDELLPAACFASPTWPADGAPAERRRVASSLRQPGVARPVGDELATDEESGGSPGLGNSVDSNAAADTAGRTLADGKREDEACACWSGDVFSE